MNASVASSSNTLALGTVPDTIPQNTQSAARASLMPAHYPCEFYDGTVVARIPSTESLTGTVVRLDQFTQGDADELAELIMDPALHAEGFIMYPVPTTHDEALRLVWQRWVVTPRTDPAVRVSYAVRLVADSELGPKGTLVGATSFGHIEPANESLHIGWTVWSRRWWGTVVNAEAKYLMLQAAFEGFGYRRVQLQTDLENARSQGAITRLGAVREGVLRRHMARDDGTFRDTVIFSIIDDDWPGVKAGLEARLNR